MNMHCIASHCIALSDMNMHCIACLPPTLGQYMSVEFTNRRAIVRSYSFIALAVGSPTVISSDGKSLEILKIS